jgi:AcrR family transcriptional regulator
VGTTVATQPTDSSEARDKILATAARLFAQNGYDNTSLSQVAREANVSKALIFWHFDSKEALYRTALRKTLEPYFINADALEGLSAAHRLERLIDQFYEFVLQNVYSVRFFLGLALRGETRPDEGLAHVVDLYRAFRHNLTDIIEGGRQRGEFRADADSRHEAALILSTLGGILIQQFMPGDGATVAGRPD